MTMIMMTTTMMPMTVGMVWQGKAARMKADAEATGGGGGGEGGEGEEEMIDLAPMLRAAFDKFWTRRPYDCRRAHAWLHVAIYRCMHASPPSTSSGRAARTTAGARMHAYTYAPL